MIVYLVASAMAATIILTVLVVVLRWLDRADVRYPHEQGDTEDFR